MWELNTRGLSTQEEEAVDEGCGGATEANKERGASRDGVERGCSSYL